MTTLVRLAIVLASIPLNGYALSVLWGWFVSPLGVARLGVAQALGVATLLGLFMRNKADDTDETRSAGTRAAIAVFVPMFALGIGWIEHWFMVRP